jgi:hypothetical protein
MPVKILAVLPIGDVMRIAFAACLTHHDVISLNESAGQSDPSMQSIYDSASGILLEVHVKSPVDYTWVDLTLRSTE